MVDKKGRYKKVDKKTELRKKNYRHKNKKLRKRKEMIIIRRRSSISFPVFTTKRSFAREFLTVFDYPKNKVVANASSPLFIRTRLTLVLFFFLLFRNTFVTSMENERCLEFSFSFMYLQRDNFDVRKILYYRRSRTLSPMAIKSGLNERLAMFVGGRWRLVNEKGSV